MRDTNILEARILQDGQVEAPIMKLDDALSFWGGFDPKTGTIIDQHHPQVGQQMAGKILVLPATRGSSGTPGVLAEALRLGTGPLGIILGKADANVVAASVVVDTLYDMKIPVLVMGKEDYQAIPQTGCLSITANGSVRIV